MKTPKPEPGRDKKKIEEQIKALQNDKLEEPDFCEIYNRQKVAPDRYVSLYYAAYFEGRTGHMLYEP